jgi:hypothetical protein
MQFRIIPLLTVLIIGSILALGHRNGRAASQNRGNSGAPGDEQNTNGTIKTCVNCHNVGPITATVDIYLLDATGDTVTTYTPGQNYTVRVKINGVGSTIQGYGFQMIGLRNSNNTDLDGFSDAGTNPTNNYKIASISNGRTYAEHDNVSTTDTFNVRWQAPAAGTGEVKFYASGNAVNRNGGTSGDGAGVATLTVTEQTSSTFDAQPRIEAARVWPNPIRSAGQLRFTAPQSADYQILAYDINGRVVLDQNNWLAAGEQTLPLTTGNWQAGTYWVHIQSGIHSAVLKVVKL